MRGLTLAVALICCALGGAAAAQSTPKGELRTMAEEKARVLDRNPGPYQVSRAPYDGQRLTVNPPVFVWLPVEGAGEYILQYSRDREFSDRSTVTIKQDATLLPRQGSLPFQGPGEFEYTAKPATMRVLRETLQPGEYFWRYGYDAGAPVGVVFSKTWTFTVADEAVAIPFPDVKQVVARVSAWPHPRVLETRMPRERLRELARGVLKDDAEQLKRDCDGYLGQVLLPEPQFLPKGDDWAPTYQRVFRATRGFFRGMEQCAEAYLITGDEKHGQEAKRRLLHTVSWDPNGSTSLGHNDEPGTEIVRLGTRVYDYVYDLLSESERAKCRKCFAVRMPQLYWALKARPFEVNPFESHAMGYYLEDLTEACMAMAGELNVQDWLEYCLMMMWGPFFPPYGGADGGWCEGPSYWGWTAGVFMRMFRLVEEATGVPIHQREWMRNTGFYKLYDNPPYAKMSPFGDGQYGRPSGDDAMWDLAMAFGNPYFKWWADARGYSPSGLTKFLFHDQTVDAKAPSDLPQARCFSDVGLVAMHSDLANGERNVQVLMRSSPYGSISHAYADQNAFTLDAFGEPLAIASGYYPWYGSPHHQQWSWQTKAANAIGVDGEGQAARDWNARGAITHFETSDYCHYALGDATAAYQGRLTKWDRHILYLRPLEAEMTPIVVIYDDLAAPKPATFQWWLHALEQMQIGGQRVRISRAQAQADVIFLTPDQLKLSQTDQFTVPPERELPSQWHLTAETTQPSETCRFLTVLLPHRVGAQKAASARLVLGNGYLGAEIAVQGRRHVVGFRTGIEPITLTGASRSGDVCAVSWGSDGKLLGEAAIRLHSQEAR
jgi:hypothetical protein